MQRLLRKSNIVATLFAALVLLLPCFAYAAGITVIVDEKELAQSGVMQNGSVLVPMRGIFEALGAEVKWQPATRSVVATRGTTEIVLTLGHHKAFINDSAVELAAPAASVDGTTMVPLRFVGEALGADVKWNGATQTVTVNSQSSENTEAGAPTIKGIVVSPERALTTGDTLTVELTGEAGCKATFDIIGVKTGVPMHEEHSGRYMGSLTISKSLKANEAVLMGRLNKDGKEASIKASKAIQINSGRTGRHNGPSTTSSSTGTKLTPGDGSTIKDSRPIIKAQFVREVSEGSIRFWLNDEELTNQLTFAEKSVSWRSQSHRMDAGTYNVRLSGTDNEGYKINEKWSFTISSSATTTTSTTSLVKDLTVTSPENGDTLGSTFTVAGRTEANTEVTVTVAERSSGVGAIISAVTDINVGHSSTATITSNSNGNYSIKINASSIKAGKQVVITVECKTSDGESHKITINATR